VCLPFGKEVRHLCETQWNSRDQDSTRRNRHPALHGPLDTYYQVTWTGMSNLSLLKYWLLLTLNQCLSVASGLWLGKEGPLVHVACCCANIMMKPFDSLNGNEGTQWASRTFSFKLTRVSSKTRGSFCSFSCRYLSRFRCPHWRCAFQPGGT
jgi:hypothetical protein